MRMNVQFRPRQARPLVVLRPVPGNSALHRLWAGTKILAVLALTVVLGLVPTWPAIGMTAAAVVCATLLAGVPRGALPTIPRWFYLIIAIGAVINIPSGGVLIYFRSLLLGFVVLAATALIGWTTRIGDLAPAIAALLSPLRLFRLPVREWSTTVALCLRGLPMLLEEFRVLWAARKLRPPRVYIDEHGNPQKVSGGTSRYLGVVDVSTAALAAAVRRASELGDAITARGGAGQIAAHRARPGWRDAIAAVVVAALCTAIVWLG